MSMVRATVMSLAVVWSVSAVAGTISDLFPALTPVVEYDVTNWANNAIPNTGSRTGTGSQVGGATVLDESDWLTYGYKVTSANEFGAPVYRIDEDRPYMSFEKFGHIKCSRDSATTSNSFDFAVGYTLVGYYRITEEFATFKEASIGVEYKSNENTLLEFGGNGGSPKSMHRVWGDDAKADDMSDVLPDGWFQIVKTFNTATKTVDYYINDRHVLTTEYDFADGSSFEYLWGALGDIGVYLPSNPVAHHQVKGLDYGYFAAYNRVLSAEDVRDSYAYLTGIPEPMTMSLLVLGGLALLRRR